jgi:hypothetical protein
MAMSDRVLRNRDFDSLEDDGIAVKPLGRHGSLVESELSDNKGVLRNEITGTKSG